VARLVFEQRRLLRDEARIVARPRGQRAAIELEDARREARQQRAIVRHEEDGAAELEEPLFQRLDRLDVEMVGGFVEEQEIGIADQRAGERHAPSESPRQVGDLRVGVESVDRERGGDALVQAPAVAPLDLVLELLDPAQRRAAGRDLVGGVVILREQRADLGEPARDHVEDRRGLVRDQLLRELRDAQPGLAPDLAAVRRDPPRRDAEQGGLPRAVPPDQADALAGVQLERGAVEQRLRSERDRDLVEALERHARMLEFAAAKSPPAERR